MIFCGLWYRILWLQNSLAWNSDIQGSFKKCWLPFRQSEIIFVVIWFLYHFSLEHIPSVNGVWIITFVSHLHVWVTKFKLSFMFFQLLVLTSNNVAWVDLSAILFDETQNVVKTSTTGYVPVCYEIINLFIKPQNFLLMFFNCKLKGFYLIIFFFDGFLTFFLHFVCKQLWNLCEQHIAAVSPIGFCLWLLAWK